MFIEKLTVGNMESNSYIVADRESAEAIVIDPGGEAKKILEVLTMQDLTLKYVVNTHGHIDHIAANEEILTATNAQLLIHKSEADFLDNADLNLSSFMGTKEVLSPQADKTLDAKAKIEFGEFELKVLYTPGHTKGSICLLGDEVLFSGDTLFAKGVGRTDLPTGSRAELNQSLTKLKELNDKIKVYPGHGPTATLAEIKDNNPYM